MLINLCIYLIMAVGIGLLAASDINLIRQRILLRRRLRSRKEKRGKLRKEADLLVEATLGFKDGGKSFIAGSAIVMIITMLVTAGHAPVHTALLISIMAAATPYIILRVILINRRNEGSKEGECFTATLLAKYRLSTCQIERALELIISERDNEEIRICRQLCERILQNIREAKSSEELKAAGEPLIYSVRASWADMVAELMGMAAEGGTHISQGLEDVLVQLREARNLREERSRLNSEAGRIVLYMIPLSYIVTFYFSVAQLGISIGEIINNQFGTAVGLMLFFSIIFTFILNLMLLQMVQHMRFDY